MPTGLPWDLEQVIRKGAKVRHMIRKVEKAGWVQVPGGKGSHRKFKHPSIVGIVVIHGGLDDDLAPGTEASIKKAAGIQ